MKQVDLARIVGSQSAAAMLLSGQRQPSKAQIRKLAERFKVDPMLFR
jgi:antitoxin component HigA of HigAB toxin-antitoxin module